MSIATACTRYLPLALLAACSPELNWRVVKVPEMRVSAQFPCKPQRHVQGSVGLVHCEAAGARFVLGWRPLGPDGGVESPERVVLEQLELRMKAKALRLAPGVADRSSAERGADGVYFLKAADGSSAWAQQWVNGSVLSQALVVGADSGKHREAAEEFLSGLRSAE